MGDRTDVTLTVLKQHVEEAIDLIEPEKGQPSYLDDQDEDTVTLTYEQVNYGTIKALVQFSRMGIPYSFQWGSGGTYDEGEEHLRFLKDGTPTHLTFSKDWPENTLLECLEAVMGQADPEQAIRSLLNQNQEPSWDHQLEHSNMARATNLIQLQQ